MADLKKELKDAKAWALKNLKGKKVYHKDINEYIYFNEDGLSHAIYAKTYYLKIQLIYHAKRFLESSRLYSIEKDKLKRKDIKNIYKFVATTTINAKKYFVYIIVRETKEGIFYYDHGKITKKP